MEAITLAQLLEAVHGTLLGDFRDENVIVQRVDTDSRTIHPGSLFIPLVGERFDGHAYINAALEGGAAALATASGAAAITYAVQNIAKAGDHIVSSKRVYGGTYNLFAHTLPAYGITCTFVDPDEPGEFERAIRPETKAIFLESVGNPNSSLVDLDAVAALAHAHGLPLLVDNTFATPYLLRPLEHGADIVVHSATKFIGGHGTAVGGVIVDGGRFDWSASGRFGCLTEPDPSYHGVVYTEAAGALAYITKARVTLMRDTGAVLSPFHAFLFLQGLETLSLRVERHVENALRAAEFLARHPRVERVNHPALPDSPYHALYRRDFPKGAGSEAARAFIDRLQVFSLLANVADVKSLAIHPASTTHSQMSEEELAEAGIRPGTVRLSIGTEHIDDILADLEQALK